MLNATRLQLMNHFAYLQQFMSFTAHRRYAGAFFPVAVPGDAEPG